MSFLKNIADLILAPVPESSKSELALIETENLLFKTYNQPFTELKSIQSQALISTTSITQLTKDVSAQNKTIELAIIDAKEVGDALRKFDRIDSLSNCIEYINKAIARHYPTVPFSLFQLP